MSSDHIVKSKHWLARAAEIRAIAASMAEDGIRASMLRLAKDSISLPPVRLRGREQKTSARDRLKATVAPTSRFREGIDYRYG